MTTITRFGKCNDCTDEHCCWEISDGKDWELDSLMPTWDSCRLIKHERDKCYYVMVFPKPLCPEYYIFYADPKVLKHFKIDLPMPQWHVGDPKDGNLPLDDITSRNIEEKYHCR